MNDSFLFDVDEPALTVSSPSTKKLSSSRSSYASTFPPPSTALADSGTSGHYFAVHHSSSLIDVHPSASPISVILADGTTATSTHNGKLILPNLRPAIVHIFPNFPTSLVSISSLCTAGYTVRFDNASVTVLDVDGHALLSGPRDPSTGLWVFPLPTSTVPPPPTDPIPPPTSLHCSAAAFYPSSILHTQADLAAWYHASMGSLPIPTLHNAINRGWITLPGLSPAMVRKLRPSTATYLGHLDQKRQGLDSSRPPPPPPPSVSEPSMSVASNPESSPPPIPPNTILLQSSSMAEAALHVDLTGRFPAKSRLGFSYVLIMYNPDTDYILAVPQRTKSAADYVASYTIGLQFWASHGIIPTSVRIDNESSDALLTFLRSQSPTISVEKCPPGMHRASGAERAIRTWKNHFLATLATTDPDFPASLWADLLPHTEVTLNSVRASASNPDISAYHQVHGHPFDFRAHPFAPAGMKIVSHDKPDARASFAPHGVRGWYLGPALSHYRCHNVYIPSSKRTRVTDTIGWLPTAHLLPQPISLRDFVSLASFQLPRFLASAVGPCRDHLTAVSTAVSALHTSIFSDDPIDLHVPPTHSPAVVNLTDANILPAIPPFLSEGDLLHVDTLAGAPVVPIPPPPPPPGFPPLSPPPTTEGGTLQPIPAGGAVPPADTSSLPLSIGPRSSLQPPLHTRRPRVPNPRYSNLSRLDNIFNPHLADPLIQHRSVRMALSVLNADAFATDNFGQPLTYRSAKRGQDAHLWELAESTELSKLLSRQPKAAQPTMQFMKWADRPKDRTTSYYNPQVKVKQTPTGDLDRRVRGTYGGNITDFNGLRSSWTADLQTVKILLNATISEDAFLVAIDIKDFYLATPSPKKEYMRIHRNQLPVDILTTYASQIDWHNDHALVQVNNTIYGLPYAGRESAAKVTALLSRHGYLSTNTPCLFRHVTSGVTFTLVVDDYLVKFSSKADAEHLIAILELEYDVKVDWSASRYLGMTITQDKTACTITLSMPGYVEAALKRFGVVVKAKPTVSPAVFTPPNYGAPDTVPAPDTSPPLTSDEIKFVQAVIGVFLYYARAVDPTMLTQLSKLATMQSPNPTQHLLAQVGHFLQYAATFPNASVVFHASGMLLVTHSDASYLSETKARSRAAGVHYLTTAGDPVSAPINGAIDVITCIIPTVVSAASEAEYAGLFINAQAAVSSRTTLEDLGYPQPPTPIICDNTTATGIANRTTRLRRSKAIDMRYHWVRDRVAQGQFRVLWRPASVNKADFFTKTLPASKFFQQRRYYVTDSTSG